MIRWPWKRRGSSDLMAVSWSGDVLAYVHAVRRQDGLHEVRKFGVESRGTDSLEDFARRLAELELDNCEVRVMLRPEQYQVLQIDAPAVPPEELRSAARWQIKEMLDVHVDDITLDVMRVGDGQQKSANHLFVVVATNAQVRSVLELGDAMNWTVPVIDIQDMAQRNLQTLLAQRANIADRATAALVLADDRQAVLTISANEELFYTRRLEIPEHFLTESWGGEASHGSAGSAGINEYVPDYNVGGVSYGTDYSSSYVPDAGSGGPAATSEGAQRFLVEVQRSLDLWDRTWSNLPLGGVRVYAGARSEELAIWLGGELGQTVLAMDMAEMFPGFEALDVSSHPLCWPLLGALLRTEVRKL